MATDVGAEHPTEDITAVADPAWLRTVQGEVGGAPLLDEDGSVIIPVGPGASGVTLEGAPVDRPIKLTDLGAHQARFRIVVGPSVLQRVVVSAQERLEDLEVDVAGRLADLTVDASRDDRPLSSVGMQT